MGDRHPRKVGQQQAVPTTSATESAVSGLGAGTLGTELVRLVHAMLPVQNWDGEECRGTYLGSLVHPGIVCSVGKAQNAENPCPAGQSHPCQGNMGLPVSSSAQMQPTDHMSISGPYLSFPRMSSGGLYQLGRK